MLSVIMLNVVMLSVVEPKKSAIFSLFFENVIVKRFFDPIGKVFCLYLSQPKINVDFKDKI